MQHDRPSITCYHKWLIVTSCFCRRSIWWFPSCLFNQFHSEFSYFLLQGRNCFASAALTTWRSFSVGRPFVYEAWRHLPLWAFNGQPAGCSFATELHDHSFTSVWWLFLLEVAGGVYYLPGLGGSCSSAHQPKGKSESSIIKPYWTSDHKPCTSMALRYVATRYMVHFMRSWIGIADGP